VSSSKINQQFKQDTSSLLEYFTGIDNAANGSVSSIPYMHGLNDDRIRISVDGVDLNSACTSHTDTDLSFIDINDVDYIKVFAGITPVSVGGDSIAGSIKIKTKNPTFSQDDQLIYSTKLKSFYKSNNDEQGVYFKSSVASSNAYLKYSGSYSQSNNYSSANDFKGTNYGGTSDKSGIRDDEIASSGYRMENHQLSYGYQINNHLLEIKFDYQSIPYQGFMNQRMDVVGQHTHKIQLKDTIFFSWGKLELQAYHHQVETKMNFGKNKNFIYPPMGMGTTAYGMSMTHHGYTHRI
jgi:iron complex outermembrane receptor protein